MADDFWTLVPASSVDPWSAGAMRQLMAGQYGIPPRYETPRADNTQWSNDFALAADDDEDARARPIQVAGMGWTAGAGGRTFTPVPLPGFEEWAKHFKRGTVGLLQKLEELRETSGPSMLFPHKDCLQTCARGRPEQMEEFCRAYAKGANWKRCERAIMDLENGDIGSCMGECNAMHHNWGK
jgi:hypothetical protein